MKLFLIVVVPVGTLHDGRERLGSNRFTVATDDGTAVAVADLIGCADELDNLRREDGGGLATEIDAAALIKLKIRVSTSTVNDAAFPGPRNDLHALSWAQAAADCEGARLMIEIEV